MVPSSKMLIFEILESREIKMAPKKSAPASEPLQVIKFDSTKKAEVLAKSAATTAGFAASALMAAELMDIQTKRLEHFTLSPDQREVLLAVPGILKSIKTKLAKPKTSFTVAEVACMTMALAEFPANDDPRKQIAVLLVAKHLSDRLLSGIIELGDNEIQQLKEPKTKLDRNPLFQFKITLLGSKPPIWRRIQTTDCTLDKLHEHIQTSMGWTNSHLHHFRISKQLYGDPMLMREDMQALNIIDSTRTKISKILPKTADRFSFIYEYDFGDCWEHEILFEGCPKKEPGIKYPLCLEGERACPPEDVGGIGSYHEFLKALANPRNERHTERLEWIGGKFDSKAFDATIATKEMKKGLPDD
jgi:hypothetical protein